MTYITNWKRLDREKERTKPWQMALGLGAVVFVILVLLIA